MIRSIQMKVKLEMKIIKSRDKSLNDLLSRVVIVVLAYECKTITVESMIYPLKLPIENNSSNDYQGQSSDIQR